jgi:hypothetical protein
MGRSSRAKRERREAGTNRTPGYGAPDANRPGSGDGVLAQILPLLLSVFALLFLVLHEDRKAVIVGVLPGSLLTLTHGTALLRAWSARGWERTEGVVLTSSLVRDPYAADRHVFWAPVVTYSYEVDGTAYTGKRISLTGSGVKNSAGGAARQAVHELAAGRRVPVWYDPADPARAALYRHAGVASWVLFGMGVCFLAVALPAIIELFGG